jgi:hypothetical protein
MSLEIIQIVPYLPPAASGVGDYAYLLARELRAAHGINTRFLVADEHWNGGAIIDGFPVDSIAHCGAAQLEKLLGVSKAAVPVMVHYVGYGYEKRGCPLWLMRGLESWKGKKSSHRLLVMFHELYAFGPPWRSSFWNSPVQRWITARLARLADRCRSNYRLAAMELERLAPNQAGRIEVSPVFSNFGEPAATQPLGARPAQAVICGAFLHGVDERSARKRIFEKACQLLGVEKVVFFGATESRFEITDVRTERRFVLSSASAASLLHDSRIGILEYPDHCLGKSGMFASYCAHGLVPVVVSSDGSRSHEVHHGIHYLRTVDIDGPLSLKEQQRIANNAHAWYRQHNLSATAQSVAQTIVALSTRSPASREHTRPFGERTRSSDLSAFDGRAGWTRTPRPAAAAGQARQPTRG